MRTYVNEHDHLSLHMDRQKKGEIHLLSLVFDHIYFNPTEVGVPVYQSALELYNFPHFCHSCTDHLESLMYLVACSQIVWAFSELSLILSQLPRTEHQHLADSSQSLFFCLGIGVAHGLLLKWDPNVHFNEHKKSALPPECLISDITKRFLPTH